MAVHPKISFVDIPEPGADGKSRIVCEMDGKLRDANRDFYKNKEGKACTICKACLTKKVDAFRPETFTWILEACDVPYIITEWEDSRNKAFNSNPKKINSTTLGRYLSKMKLNQHKDKTWADTERLNEEILKKKQQEEEERKEAEAELKQELEEGKITQAQYETLVSVQTQYEDMMRAPAEIPQGEGQYYNETQFMSQDDLPDPSKDLTEEDKIYLATKWGRLYTPNEWIQLERQYEEYSEGFDIQDPDTRNTMMMMCKTTLKANEALDTGDMESFTKLNRALDAQRKSVKFTAAQNKEKEAEDFDSVGKIIAYCEKEGGAIPAYDITIPKDVIDFEMKDTQEYLQKLFKGDKSVAQLIENYIMKEGRMLSQEAEEETGVIDAVTDDDIAEASNSIYEQLKHDEEIFLGRGDADNESGEDSESESDL